MKGIFSYGVGCMEKTLGKKLKEMKCFQMLKEIASFKTIHVFKKKMFS